MHSDVLLLSIAYKVSAKKVQKNYLSWHLKKDPNFENRLFVWKMTWGTWWTLTRAVESLNVCTLMSYFSKKYVMFELKNTEEKNDLCRENDSWFQKWHEELDKHFVYNVSAEGMYFLDKINPSNFNFLDFWLLVWSCPNFSCDFGTRSHFLYS